MRHWILHLGFIPLGFIDSSIIPLPGSMDLLTVVLCARRALVALLCPGGDSGFRLGGLVTYHLARTGGKGVLSHRFSQKQLDRVYKVGAIAIPALLPPPAPMVPFLFAAGAMQYPVRKFLAALTDGRLVWYTILAFLAQQYGRHILRFFSAHVLLIGAGGVALFCRDVVLYDAQEVELAPSLAAESLGTEKGEKRSISGLWNFISRTAYVVLRYSRGRIARRYGRRNAISKIQDSKV